MYMDCKDTRWHIIIGCLFGSDVGIETVMSDRVQEPVSASEDDTVTNPANHLATQFDMGLLLLDIYIYI